jgi:uncharacterized membrane protein YjfL (UPF0719 family)
MKGNSWGVRTIVILILGVIMLAIMTGGAKGMIENTEETAKGCSMIASILADMFGGMGLC